jgi:hypothetical protein
MVEMESVSRIIIFGLKMMVKSGLEIPPIGKLFAFCPNSKSVTKITLFPHGGISKNSRLLFSIIFWAKMVILGTDPILTM